MVQSYAVVWSCRGGPTSAGRLELSERSLVLEGALPDGESRSETIVRAQIRRVTIVRDLAQRLADLPTLAIEVASGDLYRVASVDGPGTLSEIARHLAGARGQELLS